MTNKELNAQRLILYQQGKTDREIAEISNVKASSVKKWRKNRGLESNFTGNEPVKRKPKQRRTKSMQVKAAKPVPVYDRQFACYLSDKELNQNIKQLVAEYGIDNSPVCRKATPEELQMFYCVKSTKKTIGV